MGSHYFTDVQQDAVIEYKNSTDWVRRNTIFNKHLHQPFRQMVDGILLRYKIYQGRYHHEELVDICLAHLIEKFERFDEWKPNSIIVDDLNGVDDCFMGFSLTTDHYGIVLSATPLDGYEDPNNLLSQLIGKETVYINDTLTNCELKVRRSDNGKIVHGLFNRDEGKNRKYLKEYYIRSFPNISETDLNARLEYLRFGVYSPIYEVRKAFSYCQTIVRNFFKNHGKETYKSEIIHDCFDGVDDDQEDNQAQTNKKHPTYVIDEDVDEESLLYETIVAKMADRVELELNINEFLTEDERVVGLVLIDVIRNGTLRKDRPIRKQFIELAKSVSPSYPKSFKRYKLLYKEVKNELCNNG